MFGTTFAFFSLSNLLSIIIVKYVLVIDNILCCIINANITRPIFFVAAAEYRSWLLFYALPCLKGILSDEHFNQYALLVGGIYLLCQESISNADLRKAEMLLTHFVETFDVFYGMFYS